MARKLGDMIRITPWVCIPEQEIVFRFVRASGPGGQNVNKVATAAQLRFDVAHSESLPEELRARLMHLGGKRINSEGVLVIDAHRFRTQERNRQDALNRLKELIARAARPPRPRRKTSPTLSSRRGRLESKRRRGKLKRARRPVGGHDE